MTAARSYSSKFGSYLTADELIERESALAVELADNTILYAGQGKNRNIVHLISGGSKSVRQPNAVCGQWVSNKGRQPATSEKVCAKCSKGQRSSFSTFNQPRECLACGKRFADSSKRDSTESVCPSCYEDAGYENAHSDGHHTNAPERDCPACQAS